MFADTLKPKGSIRELVVIPQVVICGLMHAGDGAQFGGLCVTLALHIESVSC